MSQEGVPKNREQILGELAELKSKIYNIENEDLLNRMVEFVDGLKEKYPNYQDFELYHFIAGSGMKRNPVDFDFPGEDSIEVWLRENVK